MIKTVLTSIITTLIVIVGLVNFYPLFEDDNLGIASLTDLTSGDTVSNFPAVYTANNTLLEDAINTLEGTTTMSLVTSIPNQDTTGTLTTGTWNADTLTVPYGGTGSTTLGQFHILLGSTTNALGLVRDLGTSGQFLTSGGAGAYPTWATAATDQTLEYNWTNHHTFTSAFFTAASSTNATTTGDQYVGGDLVVAGLLDLTNATITGESWELLFSTTTGTALASIDATFTTHEDLRVMFSVATTSAVSINFTLNSDTGNNYDRAVFTDYASKSGSAGQTQVPFAISTTSPKFGELLIDNTLGASQKLFNFETIHATGGDVPILYSGFGAYTGADITSVEIFPGSGTLPAGSVLKVYGSKN